MISRSIQHPPKGVLDGLGVTVQCPSPDHLLCRDALSEVDRLSIGVVLSIGEDGRGGAFRRPTPPPDSEEILIVMLDCRNYAA